MEFLQGTSGQAFALYAGVAGLATACGLARGTGAPPARFESLLGPLGLAALAVSFAMNAADNLRLLAGGLLIAGLVILALVPRRGGRASPGRRVGTLLAGLAIALALAGAFLPGSVPPHSLT